MAVFHPAVMTMFKTSMSYVRRPLTYLKSVRMIRVQDKVGPAVLESEAATLRNGLQYYFRTYARSKYETAYQRYRNLNRTLYELLRHK